MDADPARRPSAREVVQNPIFGRLQNNKKKFWVECIQSVILTRSVVYFGHGRREYEIWTREKEMLHIIDSVFWAPDFPMWWCWVEEYIDEGHHLVQHQIISNVMVLVFCVNWENVKNCFCDHGTWVLTRRRSSLCYDSSFSCLVQCELAFMFNMGKVHILRFSLL